MTELNPEGDDRREWGGGEACHGHSRVISVPKKKGDFPGDTVVRTQCFHRGGPEFDPWSGN